MRLFAHGACGLRPAGTRSPRRMDDESSRLSVQFGLVRELRLIEENLRDANATGVFDLDVASWLACAYTAITPVRNPVSGRRTLG